MALAVGRRLVTRGGAAAVRGGGWGCVCRKSTYVALPNDYNCKVELALTSDGQTIVCYHPSVDIPYEHTKPILRPSPVENKEETHDQVLKARLDKEVLRDKQGPTIDELSKMFYTTKHRWYPFGQYHRRRINPILQKTMNQLKDSGFNHELISVTGILLHSTLKGKNT
ncbi:39S ribosomal protein L42, mitochondrial [Pristis pectinata]|uniref:39S ribosomal protein L42, mitochondrial n=1 Tax=Pristis pectinata TaxID=685728 RepID=UPI00223E4807|nr:39S ribosomal protein L42, mitochondrial [Pristis pectinata]